MEIWDDAFETVGSLGLELLTDARTRHVCGLCGSTLSDEANPNPIIDFEGVRTVAKRKGGKKKTTC